MSWTISWSNSLDLASGDLSDSDTQCLTGVGYPTRSHNAPSGPWFRLRPENRASPLEGSAAPPPAAVEHRTASRGCFCWRCAMRDFLRGLGAELRGIRAELTPNWMRHRRRGVV